MTTVFTCPLCGAELEREERRYHCPAGHSFDVAREGYVDLLPVSRRHSRAPGDDREMVDARRRFLAGGWYEPLRDALCRLAAETEAERPVLLDAGCGEGYYTAALSDLAAARGGRMAGVDLSKTAAKRAARLCPKAEIAVASVYHLPLGEGTADVLSSCFSPLAAEEFRRVLRPGGLFLYVVPGPRHLWELKEILYDRPYENPEKTEEYPGFRFLGAEEADTAFTLTRRQEIADLYHMTPYTWKTPREGAARLDGVDRLTVTAQFRIHRYRRE